MPTPLETIRQSEQDSHIRAYTGTPLFSGDGWLKKPVKTVLDLLPLFEGRDDLRALDLGCGVGRNAIPAALYFSHIDCVDILELAIEKLEYYAREYGVASRLHGAVAAIEDYPIPENTYDLILAISALEHIDSESAFRRKLAEIRDAIRSRGIFCLIVNSGVQEVDTATGLLCPPQFEVNLPTEEMEQLLLRSFPGWKVLKATVRPQSYDVPRGERTHTISTQVVTFVAQKP